jgi:Transcriptional regulators of sugar metabolism
LVADGFDIEQGTTTFIEAYQVSQAMCQAAKQIIVVTDSSKFGRKTPNVVVPIDKIDIVITDHGISEADQAALEQRGIQVLLV